MNVRISKLLLIIILVGLIVACKKNQSCESQLISPKFEYSRYQINNQIFGFGITCSDDYYFEVMSMSLLEEIDTNAVDTITLNSASLFYCDLSTTDSSVCAELETWSLINGQVIFDDSSVYLGMSQGNELWDRYISFKLIDAVFQNNKNPSDTLTRALIESPYRLNLTQ